VLFRSLKNKRYFSPRNRSSRNEPSRSGDARTDVMPERIR